MTIPISRFAGQKMPDAYRPFGNVVLLPLCEECECPLVFVACMCKEMTCPECGVTYREKRVGD